MSNEFDFAIWTQADWIMDIWRTDITRNLYARGRRICFFTGAVLGEYSTCERAFEVWKALKKAAQYDSAFIFPKE